MISILAFSEFSSKLDGVIFLGSVDDAALLVITKKNRNRINNFKNLQKVFLQSDSYGDNFKKRLQKTSTKRNLRKK